MTDANTNSSTLDAQKIAKQIDPYLPAKREDAPISSESMAPMIEELKKTIDLLSKMKQQIDTLVLTLDHKTKIELSKGLDKMRLPISRVEVQAEALYERFDQLLAEEKDKSFSGLTSLRGDVASGRLDLGKVLADLPQAQQDMLRNLLGA